MAWYEQRTNFDNCNGNVVRTGAGALGVTAGLIMAAIMIMAVFGSTGSCGFYSYKNNVSYWRCAADEKCQAPKSAVLLRKLLFADRKEAAGELKSFLVFTQKNATENWSKERLVAEVRAGMDRIVAIKLVCSFSQEPKDPTPSFPACNQQKLITKLQKGEKIELFPTGAVVLWSIAGAFYLLAGFVLMDRFIAHFGRPSGELIAWMAFFAPIFAPFWAIVGLSGLALRGAKSVKQGVGQYRNRRAQEKNRREEERIYGEDLLKQKQKVANLVVEAQKIQDTATRENLLNILNRAKKLLDDEAKMRFEMHREAVSRALRDTDETLNLAQEVDEALFQAEAHKEAREITRK